MSQRDALSPGQQALLAQRLRGRAIAPPLRPFGEVPIAGTDEPVPLSAEQEQILYHTYFVPGNPIYNEAITIIKRGPLDVDALRLAFNQFAGRHNIWHTTFQRVDRRIVQVVGAADVHSMPVQDLSAMPADRREIAAAELVADTALLPYDLKRGPMVRPILVRFTEDEHRLYLALHHIIFDGVSLYRIVLPELVALYEAAVAGRPSPLPPAVQYADYVMWQRSGALNDEVRRYLPYWREHLAGAPPTLNLPLTRPRPLEPRYHGTTEWFVVPRQLVGQLRDLGTSAGCTLFHVLVSAYALLLQRYTGAEDVVFSTVADLRRRQEFEMMVGYCLTPMPLRLRLSAGTPFADLVADVRNELLDGLSRLMPFERLVQELNPPTDRGTNPIFQAQIVLEPPTTAPHPDWSLHQLDAKIGQDLGHAKTDFHMELDQRPEGHLSGRFIFNTDLFDPDFGVRVVADWSRLLNDLVTPTATNP